jgi:hypothetical protein
MDLIKNLSLQEAAARMGLAEREVVRLAQRGEITRIKKNGDYIYRVKTGQVQPAEPSSVAFSTREPPISSPQEEHGFIVLRQAHQNATALVRQLQQDNNGLKEQLEKSNTQNLRRLFRWKSAAVACVMTILLLGSGLVIGWNFYQGRGRDILEGQQALAVTRDHLEFKVDSARQQAQRLKDQLDQAQLENLDAQKQIDTERGKIDQANARIDQLSRAVLDMMKEHNNRLAASPAQGIEKAD